MSSTASVHGGTCILPTSFPPQGYAASLHNRSEANKISHYAPDSQTGPLGDPSTTPNARVTWQAVWTDGIGRQVAAASYGTNGGTALTRPATIPSRSDTVLISTVQYNDVGDRELVFDPNNQVTRLEYDDAGRTIKLIENYQSSGPVQPDVNRTTETSYNPDSNVATLTAWNTSTGNQTTNYSYGTTLSDSDIATSTLLQQVAYPDSVDGSDVVLFAYNRQGQRKAYTDQRGCSHEYLFDGLGRQIHDCVTAVGTGVDAGVLRLSTEYDVRGLVSRMSSFDNASVGTGSVLNQVQNVYNDFAQLTQSYQAHGGAVNTGTTPQVQYSYANGSSNTIRITGVTYPNGRNVVDDYGTTGSMNDAASRIFGMKDSGAFANLVEYSYLGLSGFVKTVYPESSVQYTLIGTTGGTNPDSGDIYLGLDRFGRVTDAHWANVAGTSTLARIKYGYNRVSNRTWRDNLSPGMTGYDELYGYDQLQRLQDLGRGTLNGTQTAITSATFGQDWTLDETGNWSGFKQDDTGGGTWNLDQSRTANTVNEIKTITNATSSAWTTPAYDAAGNMTKIPVPGTLPDGVAWNSMLLSEWDNLKLADWDELTLDNVEGVYDAWNRLVRLHVGNTTLAEYAYDARGYRIRKDSYTSGTLSEARHYYYTPGWQVIEERVGSSTAANRQFVWGLRYIDDLVLRDRDTDGNGTLDERRYCLQDGNWNTIAIANTTGTVTERFSYDAYGVPTFLTSGGTLQGSSPTGWETLYAGYRWDGDPSRMYYVRNRMLLPNAGTWNRRDPADYADKSLSLTAYVRNRPLSFVDPRGLKDESELANPGYRSTGWVCEMPYWENPDRYEPPQYIYVINRNLGRDVAQGGIVNQHIDLAIPGAGVVGYFGYAATNAPLEGLLSGMPGTLNNTGQEWLAGPAARPNYVNAPKGSAPSTIVKVQVTQAQIDRMKREIQNIDRSPGQFNLATNNCSRKASEILVAGDVLQPEKATLFPNELVETLVRSGGEQFLGGVQGSASVDANGNYTMDILRFDLSIDGTVLMPAK